MVLVGVGRCCVACLVLDCCWVAGSTASRVDGIAADSGGYLIRCEGKAVNIGCSMSAESAVRG